MIGKMIILATWGTAAILALTSILQPETPTIDDLQNTAIILLSGLAILKEFK